MRRTSEKPRLESTILITQVGLEMIYEIPFLSIDLWNSVLEAFDFNYLIETLEKLDAGHSVQIPKYDPGLYAR